MDEIGATMLQPPSRGDGEANNREKFATILYFQLRGMTLYPVPGAPSAAPDMAMIHAFHSQRVLTNINRAYTVAG